MKERAVDKVINEVTLVSDDLKKFDHTVLVYEGFDSKFYMSQAKSRFDTSLESIIAMCVCLYVKFGSIGDDKLGKYGQVTQKIVKFLKSVNIQSKGNKGFTWQRFCVCCPFTVSYYSDKIKNPLIAFPGIDYAGCHQFAGAILGELKIEPETYKKYLICHNILFVSWSKSEDKLNDLKKQIKKTLNIFKSSKQLKIIDDGLKASLTKDPAKNGRYVVKGNSWKEIVTSLVEEDGDEDYEALYNALETWDKKKKK
jgi:hypothetical protein